MTAGYARSGKAPASLALAAYDNDEDDENEMGVGNVSPLGGDDDDDGGSAAGAIAPASPSESVIDPTLDVLMGMEDFDDGADGGDDAIVDLLASPESPEALAPDSVPLFDPNDPIEDFPAGESQSVGPHESHESDESHVEKAILCEKGDDPVPESRPVARPLNNVNLKSLPLYPMESVPRNEHGDCSVADRPASSASGASSSSSGSNPSDRAAMLRELLGKMADMHQSLETK